MSSSESLHSSNPDSTNPTKNRIIWTLTFKNHTYYQLSLHQLQYFTFVMIGLALLWPWNCFLSASEYYTTRFLKSPSSNGKTYAKIYSSTMMSVSTVAQLIFNYYLSQKQINANYYKRFISGQITNSLIFLIMASSCVMFLKIPVGVFFFGLMGLILASSLSCCSSQNGSMAIVNIYGPLYAQGLMVGQAIAGVLPSISLIISIIVIGEKPQVEHVEKNYGVMTYYLTSTIVSCFSLILFLMYVYKYAFDESGEIPTVHDHYIRLVDESGEVNEQLLANSEEEQEEETDIDHGNVHVPFLYLWNKLKLIVITLVLVFVISLIFPVFASNIESVNTPLSSQGVHFSNSNIFIPLAFMIWNIGDLAGRIICGYPIFQIKNESKLLLYSILRVLFIPILFLCNLNNGIPKPIINSDFIYLFIQFLYGLTNGHVCSNCFMNVGPKFDKDNEKEAAGGFSTVFLSIGLALGSLISYVFVALVG